jgi:hypothetical protein
MTVTFTIDEEQGAELREYARRRGFANAGSFARWSCFRVIAQNPLGAHHAIGRGPRGSKVGRPSNNSGEDHAPSL